MVYVADDTLTIRELAVREELIYFFNPALKFLFMQFGMNKFRQYGFNSCRQTAIFSAAYLRMIMPEYRYVVYEGKFVDKEVSKDVEYEHAFVVGFPKNKATSKRLLLIDISRTSRRLLFVHRSANDLYPSDIAGYRNTKLLSIKPIDDEELLMQEEPEFLTGLPPYDLFKIVCNTVEYLKTLSPAKHKRFYTQIYSTVTNINPGGSSY